MSQGHRCFILTSTMEERLITSFDNQPIGTDTRLTIITGGTTGVIAIIRFTGDRNLPTKLYSPLEH